MSFNPPTGTASTWHNLPTTDTPVDAAHLEAASSAGLADTRTVIAAYDSYASTQYIHQDGSGLPASVARLTPSGNPNVVNTGTLLHSITSSFVPDGTVMPGQAVPILVGIGTGDIYADSTQGGGNEGGIHQIVAYTRNTGTRGTVAVFGQAEAQNAWGANFVVWNRDDGATSHGIEIDAGNRGGPTCFSGLSTGLFLVEMTNAGASNYTTMGLGSPPNSGYGISFIGGDQAGSKGGFQAGVLFSSPHADGGRVDPSCHTINGSTLVTDTAIGSGDLLNGNPYLKSVSGANIQDGTVITGVTPGVSFTMSLPAMGTATGPLTIGATGAPCVVPTGALIQAFNTVKVANALLVEGATITDAALRIAVNSGNVATASDGLRITAKGNFPSQGNAILMMTDTAGRTDTCGTTNTVATVTDVSIGNGDIGKGVSGTNVPAGTVINTVTPGVSFVMSNPATGTGSVSLVIGGSTVETGINVLTNTMSPTGTFLKLNGKMSVGLDLTGATISGPAIKLGDNNNITSGTVTGAQIGTAPTQKLTFWGGTPIVRPGANSRMDVGCGVTSGLPTVTDASVVSGDVGQTVSGPNIPTATTISSVTPGVSFVMNHNASGTATVTLAIGNGVVTGYVTGTGTAITTDGEFAGSVGTTAYTIGDIVSCLKNIGLLVH